MEAKQIPLNFTTFGCWTCLFYESSVASAIRSVPLHENRAESTSASLIFVDQIIPAEGREILGQTWDTLVFSLYCKGIWKTLFYTSDSLSRGNIPPKRMCDPVDLWIFLYGLATDVDKKKTRRWFPTGRHTWLPIIFEEQMKNSSSYTRGILKLRFSFYLSDQMRDCHAVLTHLAWHLRLWHEELSRAARFSPNAVIIKPNCRLKIELSFLDIHNNLFLSGIQVSLCRSFLYNLFAALRVIYSRCPSHLFLIFLRLFKRLGDCCEN